MTTKLIQLDDDTLIEVEAPEGQVEEISGGFAERIEDATFEKIKPLLVKACKPISEAWQEINQDLEIEQVEVELGLSFEAEGNLYVTKSKAGSNLVVKLVLKPKE